jgi:hypothetical protein
VVMPGCDLATTYRRADHVRDLIATMPNLWSARSHERSTAPRRWCGGNWNRIHQLCG